MLAACLAFPASAAPAPGLELTGLINERRAAGKGCGADSGRPAGPLAPDRRLASLRVERGGSLPAALRRADYLAARTDYIELSGPQTASEAMRMLEQRHCSIISDPGHAEIGIVVDGRSWRIAIARPLLSSDLADWRTTGLEILRLTNEARSQPRRCGDESFKPASPLEWDDQLAMAALTHSRDMARGNRFSHRGSDGSRVSDRASRTGYSWHGIGENIAAGQGSVRSAVDAWLASPGHCAAIMHARFTEMGAAYVVEPSHDSAIVWTQVFGTPRR